MCIRDRDKSTCPGDYMWMSYIPVTTTCSDATSIWSRTQDDRRVPHDVGVSVVRDVGVSVDWWVLGGPPGDPVVTPRLAPWSAQITTWPVDNAIEGIGVRHTACGDRVGGSLSQRIIRSISGRRHALVRFAAPLETREVGMQ